jgi:hypothetical protein
MLEISSNVNNWLVISAHFNSIPTWQVFVANHTSMIDFIILEQMTAFAVIMQKHPGWVGESVLPNFSIDLL